MSKFRKKPVVIEAVQYLSDNRDEINEFIGYSARVKMSPFAVGAKGVKIKIAIKTLEGCVVASIGDWIIKGVNGEFYPCKPDIFEKSYEAV